MQIGDLLNETEEDLSDDELHALIMGDRPLNVYSLQNEVDVIEDQIARSEDYRLWDVAESRVKLGLAYYRLAHADQNPRHYHEALRAFKFAWDTDYRSSECGREVLTRLINSCRDHLHVQALIGHIYEPPRAEWTLPERAAESPRIKLCETCLNRWS
jgi:hypothetical protein